MSNQLLAIIGVQWCRGLCSQKHATFETSGYLASSTTTANAGRSSRAPNASAAFLCPPARLSVAKLPLVRNVGGGESPRLQQDTGRSLEQSRRVAQSPVRRRQGRPRGWLGLGMFFSASEASSWRRRGEGGAAPTKDAHTNTLPGNVVRPE